MLFLRSLLMENLINKKNKSLLKIVEIAIIWSYTIYTHQSFRRFHFTHLLSIPRSNLFIRRLLFLRQNIGFLSVTYNPSKKTVYNQYPSINQLFSSFFSNSTSFLIILNELFFYLTYTYTPQHPYIPIYTLYTYIHPHAGIYTHPIHTPI